MVDNRRDRKRSKGTTKKKNVARKPKVAAPARQSKRRGGPAKKVRSVAKKKRSAKPASKEIRSSEPSTLGGRTFSESGQSPRRRISRSAGQSGDLQGLSRRAIVDSESVEELLEEGQTREAAAISGVENALEPDQAEVTTREVPEDDVPEEYTDED
jgi:hypothetical protein